MKIRLSLLIIILMFAKINVFAQSTVHADFTAQSQYFFCPGDTIKFINLSTGDSLTTTYLWIMPGTYPGTSTLKNPMVTYAADGDYDVTLIATDNGVSDTLYRPAYIHSGIINALPVTENFESGNINTGWAIIDDSLDGRVWTITNATGGYQQSNFSIFFDNFDYDVRGSHDEFRTTKFRLDTVPGTKLFFDVAYCVYPGYDDSLAVLISSDCGESYSTIYYKGGDSLATRPIDTVFWVPGPTEWRTDSIDLSSFAGNPELFLAFQNIAGYGENIYIDNIRIREPQTTTGLQETHHNPVAIYPVPTQDKLIIQGDNLKAEDIYIYNETGVSMPVQVESSAHSLIANVAAYPAGIYVVKACGAFRKIVKL